MITLGVADLSRARTFYERLGWRGQEVEETVFFQAGGMAVILWARHKLAGERGVSRTARQGGSGGLALAPNVRSRAEVDGVLAEAASAGAEITQAARETFYGGYAKLTAWDPDGHAWEMAWNPGFLPGPDGSITVPDFGASSGASGPKGCALRARSGCPVTSRATPARPGPARRTAGAPTPR